MGKKLSEASTGLLSQMGQADMDTDPSREKRGDLDFQTPLTKWKGDAKGDARTDAQEGQSNGKGGSTSPGAQEHPRSDTAVGPAQPGRNWGNQRYQGNGSWGKDLSSRGERQDQAQKDQMRQMAEILRAIARLCLRLEDFQSIQCLDCEFVIFLQTPHSNNPRSITEQLYQVGQEWHAQKESAPESISQPMRNVLLFCMITALLRKVQELESDLEQMQKVTEAGLVDLLGHKEVVDYLNAILRLSAHQQVVGRFHALHQMVEKQSTDIAPFSLIIHGRTEESLQMYTYFKKLSRCSIWHLIAASMRPGKLGRSPLAKAIERMLKDI
ncbi:unnamed protein product [Symbiodinium sp. CCMP2592]|nr:unnamed protein product [Symbiodinium sp. CCMP2592]